MKKGFTLVELLFVMAIIAIIAGIGILAGKQYLEKASKTAGIAELSNLSKSEQYYKISNRLFTDDVTKLEYKIDTSKYNVTIDLKTCDNNGLDGYIINLESSDFEERLFSNSCTGQTGEVIVKNFSLSGGTSYTAIADYFNSLNGDEWVNVQTNGYEAKMNQYLTATSDGSYASEYINEIDTLGGLYSNYVSGSQLDTFFTSLEKADTVNLTVKNFPFYDFSSSKLNEMEVNNLVVNDNKYTGQLSSDSYLCSNSSTTITDNAGNDLKSSLCP